MFKQILVPLDFSPHSTTAMQFAADLARRYGGSVTLLHVHDPVPYALPASFELLDPEQRRQLEAEVDKSLSAAQRRAETAGAPSVRTKKLEGSPATQITRFAGEGGFDLIVMGTHGRRGIKHAVLGSVAERVVRSAPCAVLTVRAPEEALAGAGKVWPPGP